MLCCELLFTSILHIHAFSWRVYDVRDREESHQGGRFGGTAILDALNFCDLFRACGGAVKWVVKKEKREWTTGQVRDESGSRIVLLPDEKCHVSLSKISIKDEVEQVRWLEPVYSKLEKSNRSHK